MTLGAKLRGGSLPKDVFRRRDAVMALQQAKGVLDSAASLESREAAIEANKKSPDLIPAAAMAVVARPSGRIPGASAGGVIAAAAPSAAEARAARGDVVPAFRHRLRRWLPGALPQRGVDQHRCRSRWWSRLAGGRTAVIFAASGRSLRPCQLSIKGGRGSARQRIGHRIGHSRKVGENQLEPCCKTWHGGFKSVGTLVHLCASPARKQNHKPKDLRP